MLWHSKSQNAAENDTRLCFEAQSLAQQALRNSHADFFFFEKLLIVLCRAEFRDHEQQ